jgi:hypothetical protein
LIDRVATDALAAPLKGAVFRKQGRTWRRMRGGAVQVIHVQASLRNAGADGRFYLSAGVYFRVLAVRLALFPPTDTPGEADCHVRTRPMPPGRHWWEVRLADVAKPDPDAGRVLGAVFSWLDRRADRKAPATNARATSELADSLERYALPWLEQMADLRAARDELVRRGPRWWGAAASLELGERDEAGRILAQAIAEQTDDASVLREWGRANGLVP